MRYRMALLVSATLALVACGHAGQQPQEAATPSTVGPTPAPAGTHSTADVPLAGTEHFRSERPGFRISYPQDMASSTRFDSKYLANDSWKTYASADSSGTPVFMLTLPGSNDVTAGELRIGVSDKPEEMARCDTPPSNADPQSIGKTTINGSTFTRFHAADAGMSHYLKVHGYRTVHDGRCYAIDLLVTGTNPKVYDPPRTPPFGQKEAFGKLHAALQGFRFTQ